MHRTLARHHNSFEKGHQQESCQTQATVSKFSPRRIVFKKIIEIEVYRDRRPPWGNKTIESKTQTGFSKTQLTVQCKTQNDAIKRRILIKDSKLH